MTSYATKVADVIVPEIFTPYVQQITQEKSRIIKSGAMVTDGVISSLLAGGGLTFNIPSWKDLANDTDNVSSSDDETLSTPKKTGTAKEIAVRLNRNNSWATMDLAAALAGADPMQSIANRVADYWARRLQAATIAAITGVFADNAAAPSGSEHVQNDLTYDIKGASYAAGVTDFSAAAFLDALVTMGDSSDNLSMIMVHSIVFNRMKKNNLIDYIPDSQGVVNIPTFLSKTVIVDDAMPAAAGVYESWIFGPGAIRFGTGSPKVPTEIYRTPSAGNGAGEDTLFSRVEWCIHPTGHKYAGTAAEGGPSNASSSNNLAAAGSWMRVYPERKQINIARLITRES